VALGRVAVAVLLLAVAVSLGLATSLSPDTSRIPGRLPCKVPQAFERHLSHGNVGPKYELLPVYCPVPLARRS
jgi:hypothetical protein